MNSQDSAQEKTHEPTPGRLQKAREDGEVAVSTEAHLAGIYLFSMLTFLLFGSSAAIGFIKFATGFFNHPESTANTILWSGDYYAAARLLSSSVLPFLPFFIAPILAIFISMTAQNALIISPKRLKFQLSRLSLIANAKKKYGPNGIVEFGKTLLKVLLILTITYIVVANKIYELPYYARNDATAGIIAMQKWIITMLGIFCIIALSVAAIDVPWQQFQHRKKLRMSYEELKEETKQNEGDPHLKQARNARAQAIAQNQMMNDVPKADVVLVNPTHYAVALKWDRKPGAAPICVAKGVDEIALKIKEVAAQNGVPIKSDPPTARSIYALVEIGMEINEEHYMAVAAAIHFAEAIKKKTKESYG